MIIDSTLEFSVGQTVAASDKSTNKIDLSAERNIGPGRTMWVVVLADAKQATDPCVVSLESAKTEGGSYSAIASVTVPVDAPLGSRFVMGVPYANNRFLQLSFSKAGKFSAFLTDQEPASWSAYPGVN